MFSIGRVHATVFTNYSGHILVRIELENWGCDLWGKNRTANFITIDTEYQTSLLNPLGRNALQCTMLIFFLLVYRQKKFYLSMGRPAA
jgi:hypothetical protein